MAVFIFILWIILNGRVTVELVLTGLVITAAVSAFAWRVIGYSPLNDLRILKNLPVFILYVLNLILEILKAAFTVMKLLFRADDPDPVIVEFHSGLQTEMQNVLLANSITLTPGTITIFQEGDHFVIHCLCREYSEGLETSSFIRLLNKLK